MLSCFPDVCGIRLTARAGLATVRAMSFDPHGPGLFITDDVTMLAATALVALALDAAFGDPPMLYGRVPHPVALFGRLVGWCDSRFNRPHAAGNVARGAMLVVLLVGSLFLTAWLLSEWLHAVPGGWLIEAALASTLLAARGLYDAVAKVAAAMDSGLAPARAAIAHIVGRDPESLDEAGIGRAAVESLMENFSDGVVAPLFWFLLLGLPGLVAYKAINTCDSMLGHRSPRHLQFGRFAARLDDAVNLVPARLAGALLCLSAIVLPGCHSRAAWQAMWRDARWHRSPNAGWQEAAAAGALGLALAGPRRYGGEVVDDRWMGNGRADVTADDVRRGLRLYLATNVVIGLGLIALFLT